MLVFISVDRVTVRPFFSCFPQGAVSGVLSSVHYPVCKLKVPPPLSLTLFYAAVKLNLARFTA
jgi:hypothetical protein